MQVILIQYVDDSEGCNGLRNIKAKVVVSDGIWAAMGLIHASIQQKIEMQIPNMLYNSGQNLGRGGPEASNLNQETKILKNDIIAIKKCSIKFIRNNGDQLHYPLFTFLEPPSILYTNIEQRIGKPKEFTKDQLFRKDSLEDFKSQNHANKDNQNSDPSTDSNSDDSQSSQTQQKGNKSLKATMKIPYSVILKNFPDLEYHELVYYDGGYIPIKRLYPFIKGNWRIKVRILKKGEKRTWSNERGQGQLMNVDIIDQAGTEVQATCFQEQVDRFDGAITVGGVYLISNGVVKPVKENKYNNAKTDMTLVLDKNTKIERLPDDQSIDLSANSNTLIFTQISEVKSLKIGTYIDVIGVVVNMGQAGLVPSSSGQGITRRNVVIADESQFTTIVGFWGEDAVNVDLQVGSTVIAIKNAQVSDYAGKSLNCNPGHTSKIFVDPKLEKSNDILSWYVNLDDDSRSEFKSVSRGVALDSNPANNDYYDQKFLDDSILKGKKPLNIDQYMVNKKNQSQVNQTAGTNKDQDKKGVQDKESDQRDNRQTSDQQSNTSDKDSQCQEKKKDRERSDLELTSSQVREIKKIQLCQDFDPEQVKEELIKLKRKQLQKKWYTKTNSYFQQYQEYQYAQLLENKSRGKTCSSGIGEERIKQREIAKAQLEKAKEQIYQQHGNKYGAKFGFGTGAIGAVDSMFQDFNQMTVANSKKPQKRDINMIDYDRAYLYQGQQMYQRGGYQQRKYYNKFDNKLADNE